MEQLQKLLYRKKMCEQDIKTLLDGANIYSEYLNQLSEQIKAGKIDKLELSKLKKELHENTWTCRVFIQSYKETKREYEHHICPAISEAMKALEIEETDDVFNNCDELAGDLVFTELYGKTTPNPENVELAFIVNDFEEAIGISMGLLLEARNKILKTTDKFEKACLKKLIFNEERILRNLQKRLNVRNDYYINDFLPRFTKELAEAKLMLEKYLERGKKLVEKNVDPKLQFLLDEYSKHSSDEEKLWLFYTSLKARVDQITDFILLNPKLNPGLMELGQKVQ